VPPSDYEVAEMPRFSQKKLTHTAEAAALFPSVEHYGHAASAGAYELIAEHGIRLAVGRRQQIALFGDPDPQNVVWGIRDIHSESDVAHFNGSDRLDWLPNAPGWFEVTCFPSPAPDLSSPLTLLQRVVEAADTKKIESWTRRLLPSDPALGPLATSVESYFSNTAWLAAPEVATDLLTLAWEWIYSASIDQGAGKFPPRLLAAVVLRSMLRNCIGTRHGLNAGAANPILLQEQIDKAPPVYSYFSSDGLVRSMAEDPPLNAANWYGDAPVGFASLIPSVAAGMLGFYPQRTNVPASGRERDQALSLLQNAFTDLSPDRKADVLNVLRFGRSSVSLLAHELTDVINAQKPSAVGEALLNEANENLLRQILLRFT
jgi:hypothetical protein